MGMKRSLLMAFRPPFALGISVHISFTFSSTLLCRMNDNQAAMAMAVVLVGMREGQEASCGGALCGGGVCAVSS